MSVENQQRLNYLDATRSFAVLLGILFHASLSFMPTFIGWAVMDINTSEWMPAFVLVSHAFRMPLFFLLAGFFSHMLLQQKGPQAFIRKKFMRIFIPFVGGWLLLRPLLVSGWLMGAESMRGEADVVGALTASFTALAELPRGLLLGTHLWFLYYLILVTAIAMVLSYLIGLSVGSKEYLNRWLDRLVYWLCHWPFGIVVLAIPVAACLWFMQRWGIDTPDRSLTPHTPVALLYLGFFLFGWLLHRQPRGMEAFAVFHWLKLVVGVFGIIGAISLSGYEMQQAEPYYPWVKTGFMLCHGVMTWSLVALSISLCRCLFGRPSKVIGYLAEASYWLYLIHLPIVIWLQVAVAELPMAWPIKWLAVTVATLAVSLFLYDGLVRSTWIGALLNGKRRSRALCNWLSAPRAVHGVGQQD